MTVWDPASGSAAEQVVESGDPFEVFNHAMGMGVVQDPYPDFIPLREKPIVEIDLGDVGATAARRCSTS